MAIVPHVTNLHCINEYARTQQPRDARGRVPYMVDSNPVQIYYHGRTLCAPTGLVCANCYPHFVFTQSQAFPKDQRKSAPEPGGHRSEMLMWRRLQNAKYSSHYWPNNVNCTLHVRHRKNEARLPRLPFLFLPVEALQQRRFLIFHFLINHHVHKPI